MKKFAFRGLLWISFAFSLNGIKAQSSVTIPAGSFIVNMGVEPQTINNGLKPYGLIYELLSLGCPVHWIIKPNKTSQYEVDFTYNGIDFKSGAFVIEKKYRTPAVNNLISTWTNPAGTYRVVGITTTSPMNLDFPLLKSLHSVPRWTLDQQNGRLAIPFFTYASIPPFGYGGSNSDLWPLPETLDCCDDLFVMPHADPTWTTHRNLYDWNEICKGAIWLGCHAGSALENMFDDITIDGDSVDPNQQTNFLTEKSGPAIGAGPWSDPGNALILWTDHTVGTLPYSLDTSYSSDPVAQYLGAIDIATQNGSEQIFIPAHESPGWRPTTKVLVYDPDHPQAKNYPSTPQTHVGAVLAYGPGLGDTNRANVMLEASHTVAKATDPANIAAMRAFFNFSYLSSLVKIAIPEMIDVPDPMYSGTAYPCSFTWYGGIEPLSQPVTIRWTSSCNGTFTPNDTSQSVFFTPASYPDPADCQITVTVTDACSRVSFDTKTTVFSCDIDVTSTISNPCFGVPYGGTITMSSSGDPVAGFTWTKSGNGSGSGTGTVISGLSAGTYAVTATTISGCTSNFTVTLTQSPEILINASIVPVKCHGEATGAVNMSVSGGIPGYTYNWADGPATQNRSGLTAGDYFVMVFDSKGCSSPFTVTVPQPEEILIIPAITDVACYDENTGAVNLGVTGGTAPYTYLWDNGLSTQNRTGLAAGSYNVSVTDVNNCTQSLTAITVSQPDAALTLSETHQNISCNGDSTGSIDLSVTGGTAPFTYSWSGPGSFTASTKDISNRPAGEYYVSVTDNIGCMATLSVSLTQLSALQLTTTNTRPTCPPGVAVLGNDGAINLSVTGGAGSYSYLWTAADGGIVPAGQSTNQTLTFLVAGKYQVEVVDANLCAATIEITLTNINPGPVPPSVIIQN